VRSPARQAAACRPCLEVLEDRLVPSAASYRFTTINGPHAAHGQISLTGINSAGVIVGIYTDRQGVFHGFEYSKGRYTTINDPKAGTKSDEGTQLWGINSAGQIIGTYIVGPNVSSNFLYSHGKYIDLNDPNAVGAGDTRH